MIRTLTWSRGNVLSENEEIVIAIKKQKFFENEECFTKAVSTEWTNYF